MNNSGVRTMQLTTNFTLAELTRSDIAVRLGIDNSLPVGLMENVKRLAEALQRIRDGFYFPLHVSSGYRCLALNRLINGSVTSAHVLGLAADFTIPGVGLKEICNKVPDLVPEFDQVILEFGAWMHLGLAIGTGRQELLTAVFDRNEQHVVYVKGIV